MDTAGGQQNNLQQAGAQPVQQPVYTLQQQVPSVNLPQAPLQPELTNTPQAVPGQPVPVEVVSENQQVDNEQEQKDLHECLENMTNAFNEFHEQIGLLKLQQKDVIKHIKERIDQKKIDDIKKTLAQA